MPADFVLHAYYGQEALGGDSVRFSSLFGKGKPVVLNFFAGFCPPCRAEMPDLEMVSAQYRDKVTFVGLDVGPFVGLGSRESGKALVEEMGVTYPTGSTFDSQVPMDYRVLAMPTTVFLTPDGEVFQQWTGLLTRPKMLELTEALLQTSSK